MSTIAYTDQALPFALGEARAHAGLTVVPLFPAREPKVEYIGLDEACSRGMSVTEATEHGIVEILRVTNPLDERVLLYEGEELVGAKQNRIIRMTTLVEAGLVIDVPVDCVERGRWSRQSDLLRPVAHAAYPELRARRHAGGGQADVWASISRLSHARAVDSPSEAQDALFAEAAPSLEAYVEALPRVPGQSGLIVGVAGQVACLDYISRPDVFAGLYGKLLRGHALQALGQPAKPLPQRAVRAFLAALAHSSSHVARTAGVGAERRIAGEVVGAELAAFGETIALS